MKKINLLLAMGFLTLPALSFADGVVGFKCFDNLNNDEYRISMYLSSTEKSILRLKSSIRGDIYPVHLGQGPRISFERNNVVTISGGGLRDNVFYLNYKDPSQAMIINNGKATERNINCEALSTFDASEFRSW